MNAPNPNLPPALLRSHEHAVSMELAAQRIAAMIPTIRAACAREPVAVWGAGVPFPSIADAARFLIGIGASTATRHATETGIGKAAKVGRKSYGIRWTLYEDQRTTPARRRGPKPGRKQRRRKTWPKVPAPKENPYAPGGRLSDLAAMRGQGKQRSKV